jgi:hypothetical protein
MLYRTVQHEIGLESRHGMLEWLGAIVVDLSMLESHAEQLAQERVLSSIADHGRRCFQSAYC